MRGNFSMKVSGNDEYFYDKVPRRRVKRDERQTQNLYNLFSLPLSEFSYNILGK